MSELIVSREIARLWWLTSLNNFFPDWLRHLIPATFYFLQKKEFFIVFCP